MAKLGYAYQGNKENIAKAMGRDIRMSPKRALEVAKAVKGMELAKAKSYLSKVVSKERAVPFTRYNRDIGHRAGAGPACYPVKVSQKILGLLNEVEANASSKGLNSEKLRITHIVAHKGRVIAGRFKGSPHNTPTTNVEIVVEEIEKKEEKPKTERKTEEKKEEKTPPSTPQPPAPEETPAEKEKKSSKIVDAIKSDLKGKN